MRNNPYNKNLKDHLPLFMQGPSSTTAFISNEEQNGLVEQAMTLSNPNVYLAENVIFRMVRPPVLNLNGTVNTPNSIKIEMGQTEVTQELFQAVMGWNISSNKSRRQNPVERVAWYDCIDFCNKLSNLSGFEECYKISDIEMDKVHIKKAKVTWDESKNGFRLPTEYEWEFFAKAGTNNQWSGTNDVDKLEQCAWYEDNAVYETHPVGTKLSNEWGLYDMSGNVWEWCWDLYVSEDTENRILRGGHYWDNADSCRITNRDEAEAHEWHKDWGFRLCRSLG